jgi:hypothetical protein
VAIVAATRKLACLFWCLLTRSRPRLRAALADAQEAAPARARRRRGAGRGRLSAHRGRLAGTKEGRGRNNRDVHLRAVKRQPARQGIGPRPCALARRCPRPEGTLATLDPPMGPPWS